MTAVHIIAYTDDELVTLLAALLTVVRNTPDQRVIDLSCSIVEQAYPASPTKENPL